MADMQFEKSGDITGTSDDAYQQHVVDVFEDAVVVGYNDVANMRFARVFGNIRARRVFRRSFQNAFFDFISDPSYAENASQGGQNG